MPSFNPFPPLPIVFLSMLSFLPLTTHAAGATYLYHFCPNTTSTDNSNYLSNLRSLLSSFSLYTARKLEFYSLSYPTASLSSNVNSKIQISSHNISNPVHGLYSCRGDVTAEDCRDCVAGAAKDLASRCPRGRVAVGWYEYCMLRYSNQDIFSRMVTEPGGIYMWNPVNKSDPTRFDLLVGTTMNDLSSGVTNVGPGAKKFGTKEANFTALQTLYTLAQCTPDLSGSDCRSCLQSAIELLPDCWGKQGGRVLFPSCNVRFEVYPFYSVNTSAPTPTPGKSKILTVTIVAIVAPIAVSVVPFLLG